MKNEEIEHDLLLSAMSKAIENSPTTFIYMLDKAIKQAHEAGSNIDKVQRYYISCLLKSNGTVLTEPVYFEPF